MDDTKIVSLSSALSKKATFSHFKMWLIGDTPLICHAWNEKARMEMLRKQVKAVKAGREERRPNGRVGEKEGAD